VYENGTYMYGGFPVCLSVVAVPTPRLVRILLTTLYTPQDETPVPLE